MKALKNRINSYIVEKLAFFVVFLGNTLTGLWLIDILQQLVNYANGLDQARFWGEVRLFLGVLCLNILFIVGDQYFFRRLINYYNMDLKKYTYSHYLKNLGTIKNDNAAEIVSRLNRDVSVISAWLSIGGVNTVIQLIILTVCLILLVRYSPVIAVCVVVVIAVIFFLSRKCSIKEAHYTKLFQAHLEKLSAALYNSLLNRSTIRQLRRRHYFTDRHRSRALADDGTVRKMSSYMALKESMLLFMADLLPLLAFVLGILLSAAGHLQIGTALAAMLVTQKLNEPVIVLAEILTDKKNAQQVYERVKELYEEVEIKHNALKAVPDFEAMEVWVDRCALEQRELFRDLHFSVKKGDVMLLTGASGSGKTTLVRLISRLGNIQGFQGRILYNGENIQELDPEDYYKHLLLVEQHTVVVEGTLEDNIMLGDAFDPEALSEVIHVCCLEDFYKNRGPGYMIKENGGNISGGEKQRIGLARMLLRRPQVLLLDEVTASLDPGIRKTLVERLLEYQRKYHMTLIAISHNDDFNLLDILNKNLNGFIIEL